jgi:hypothetical protein
VHVDAPHSVELLFHSLRTAERHRQIDALGC